MKISFVGKQQRGASVISPIDISEWLKNWIQSNIPNDEELTLRGDGYQ